MKLITWLTALMLLSSPVAAAEVLYCTDKASTGFRFDKKGNATVTTFLPLRFTVKVVSAKERIIKDDGWPDPIPFACSKRADILSCVHTDGVAFEPINFGPNGYTRARLLSRPIFDLALLDMYVAYGTCAKF